MQYTHKFILYLLKGKLPPYLFTNVRKTLILDNSQEFPGTRPKNSEIRKRLDIFEKPTNDQQYCSWLRCKYIIMSPNIHRSKNS